MGPAVNENPLMRWLGQRTPTIDGDLIYAFHCQGSVICFATKTGQEVWRKDYLKEFGTAPHMWGICDRPLVDSDLLILTPGGTVASMVAVEKKTGKMVWKSESKGRASHAATVISNAAGVRQYVTCLEGKVVSFRASSGGFLWSLDNFGRTANSCTPIAAENDIIATAGFGAGLAIIKVSACGEICAAETKFTQKIDISPFQDSAVLVDGRLHVVGGNKRSCVDVATGNVLWTDTTTGRGLASMTYADGRLYVHHSEGTMALAEADALKMTVASTFQIAPWTRTAGASNPVVAGGRLYIRNDSRLLAFDVRQGAAPGGPRPATIVLESPNKAPAPPAAVYVPTPNDVVTAMLDAATVTKDDTVFDLGSGDGRIVIAAGKLGAKAVGYEIDPLLVRDSRAAIEKAGLQELVKIAPGDLFAAPLADATVVALYLPQDFLERLKPSFMNLKPGSRIVSHQFKIPGAVPEKSLQVQSKDDGDLHAVYLYTAPLKKEENK
jgi:outer membrane protein assembly factor BamB